MATYLDGTEKPSRKPKLCPACGNKIKTVWISQFTSAFRTVVASPRHVCKKCKVAVRLIRYPQSKLHSTRKAAREAGKSELKRRRKKWEAIPPWRPGC